MGRLSMHVIAHRAVRPALVPWRGTALPSDIAPEPLEPQHAPGAPHGEPGGPVAPCPLAVPHESVDPLLCRRRGLGPSKDDAVWLLGNHLLQRESGSMARSSVCAVSVLFVHTFLDLRTTVPKFVALTSKMDVPHVRRTALPPFKICFVHVCCTHTLPDSKGKRLSLGT